MMQQRVDQGAGVTACSGVYDEACGFVHGDEVFIGIKNFQRDIFGEGFEGLEVGGLDYDVFCSAERYRWFDGAAVQGDVSRLDPVLQARAAVLGEFLLQKVI